MTTTDLEKLAALLEKRISVISDHKLRDENPDEQLKQLQQVSEAINALHSELADQLKPRIAHFLESCSYDKALAWIQEELKK